MNKAIDIDEAYDKFNIRLTIATAFILLTMRTRKSSPYFSRDVRTHDDPMCSCS